MQVSKDLDRDNAPETHTKQNDSNLKAELSAQRELVSRLHSELAAGKSSLPPFTWRSTGSTLQYLRIDPPAALCSLNLGHQIMQANNDNACMTKYKTGTPLLVWHEFFLSSLQSSYSNAWCKMNMIDQGLLHKFRIKNFCERHLTSLGLFSNIKSRGGGRCLDGQM